MATLVNTETRQAESLHEKDLPQAILNGTHSYLAEDEIPVISKDGEFGSVSGKDIRNFLLSGGQIQTTSQQAVRQAVQENRTLGGHVKNFLLSAGDELGMHIPEIIADRTQDPLEVAKRKGIQEDQALTTGAGRVGGFIGSLFIPVGGEVKAGQGLLRLGKAIDIVGHGAEEIVAKKLAAMGLEKGSESIAKDLAARIAGSATNMGVQTAAFSAPRIATETAMDLQDPELSSENVLAHGFKDLAVDTLLGAGLGATGATVMKTLGLAGRPLKAILDKARDELSPENAAMRIFGVPPAAQVKLGYLKKGLKEELPSFLTEQMNHGLFTPTSDVVQGLKEIKDKSLDFIVGTADEAGVRSGGIMDQAQKIYGNVKPEIKKLLPELQATIERFKSVGGDQAVTGLEKYVDFLKTKGSYAQNIADLWSERKTLDELINYNRTVSESPELEKAYRKMREAYAETINKSIEEQKGKDIYDQLKRSNRNYEIASTVLPYAEKKGAQEVNRQFLSLRDVVYGAVGKGIGGIPGMIAGEIMAPIMKPYRDNAVLLLNEKLLGKTAKRLSDIPGMVSEMMKGKIPVSASTTSAGALSRLLDNNRPKEEQIKELNAKISQFQSNPSGAMEKLSSMTEGLPDAFQKSLISKMAQQMSYLSQNMPKPLEPPNPIEKNEWKPSDQEISQLERKLHIMQNPFSLLDSLANGSLSVQEMQAMEANYPQLLNTMRKYVYSAMVENKRNVPYATKIRLTKFLGHPFSRSMRPQNILDMQRTFMKQTSLTQPERPAKLNVKIPSMQTSVSRISNK